MLRKRFLVYIVILIACVSFTGCAGLQRKFTRKKKKEEKISPVVTAFDYSKELRVGELYKKHFLFWKTWQSELIDRMDFSYKKRSVCYDYVLESLSEMEKYLAPSKKEELKAFITRIKSIDPDIRKKRLSKSEQYRMKQLLENTKRQIDKKFAYSHIKDFLEMEK